MSHERAGDRRRRAHGVRQAGRRPGQLAPGRPPRRSRSRICSSRPAVDPSASTTSSPAGQPGGRAGTNVARNGWVSAGCPSRVPATTVDRQCGSSQQAVHFAAAGVAAGHYDLVVAVA